MEEEEEEEEEEKERSRTTSGWLVDGRSTLLGLKKNKAQTVNVTLAKILLSSDETCILL